MSSIITGAYDLHCHSGPDALPRKFDDIDMAKRCIASGMAGFAIKNHYFDTGARAKLVKKLYPEVDAVGMLWLNNPTGGMNPLAVEMAARMGTKIIGFPTVDTVNSIARTIDSLNNPGGKRGYWATIIINMIEEGKTPVPVKVFDDYGNLLPEAIYILEIIAKYDLVLATGHLSAKETPILLKAAKERGVNRIIATHVLGGSNRHELEEQKVLAGYGAKLEHCTNAVTQGKVALELMVNCIKTIGPENCIVCTDLGQTKNGYPDEGLTDVCTRFVEAGIPYADVRKMIVDNPKALIS
jgi:hypothetical protein